MHMMMLRSLTVRRVLNYILTYLSFHLSRLFKTSIHPGLPVAISIEPTTSCNLRCPQCPSGLRSFTRATGMLEDSLFRKVVDEASHHAFYLTLYFQGEPFLNPSAYSMIEYAKSKKMVVVTSTNGHYLNEENCRKLIRSGLDKLIISIDGATQESYSTYRIGGKLDTVIEGVKRLQEMKKRLGAKSPMVSIQTVVFSTNEHELEEIRKLAVEIHADELKFKSAQVYDYDTGNALLPTDERLSRYERTASGNYRIKHAIDNKCWKMWSSTVITWDGHVVPCCFDKDATYKMGNLGEMSLKATWNTQSYRAFRKTLLKDRSSIDICKNCSEGSNVFVG